MKCPRVTEILKFFNTYENIPEKTLERAADRGTSVHAICAARAENVWIPDSLIDDNLKPYVESFDKWREAQVKDFLIVEKRYTHVSYRFNGQIDFVIESEKGLKYLVDIKTCYRPQKTHLLQLAAYHMLLHEQKITVDGACVVYLSRDGHFPECIMPEDLVEETQIFLDCLNCWRYIND